MSIYSLPEIKLPRFSRKKSKLSKKAKKKPEFLKSKTFYLILIISISFFFGMLGGILTGGYFYSQVEAYLQKLNIKIPEKVIEKETVIEKEYVPQTTQEEKIIEAVKQVSPSVVSIIVTKDLPFIKQYYGGGTGFIISEDGMVLTNKHVVSDKEADYTILTNEGEKFSAEVLARDPIKDLAIIKIDTQKKFRPLKLGDSDKLQTGQTVIAIGNALGEFRNTVSTGVVSGLERNIIATGTWGELEILENVIQTDAAINRGNSGGPLLNLKGEVIGINVAMAQVAENIGFAIPINEAKRAIEQVKTIGKISYPFLGIYYTLITEDLQKEYDLPVNYGAWIGRNPEGEQTEGAIFPDSAAETAGLKRDDIILEFDNQEISVENSLAKIIMEYNPGDRIVLKILRNRKEKIIPATLGERNE